MVFAGHDSHSRKTVARNIFAQNALYLGLHLGPDRSVRSNPDHT